MEFFPIRSRWTIPGVIALAAAGAGYVAWRWYAAQRQLQGRKEETVDSSGGAFSAVTGGSPEDMNGMPPVPMDNPRKHGATIYDGSVISRPVVHRSGARHH